MAIKTQPSVFVKWVDLVIGLPLTILLLLSEAVLVLSAAVLSEAVLESVGLRVSSDAGPRLTILSLYPTGAYQTFEYEYRFAE